MSTYTKVQSDDPELKDIDTAPRVAQNNSLQQIDEKMHKKQTHITHIDYQLDDRVLLRGKRVGIIRYIGMVDFCDGIFYGIELESDVTEKWGKHDGMVENQRYFQTAINRGTFVKKRKIMGKISHKTNFEWNKHNEEKCNISNNWEYIEQHKQELGVSDNDIGETMRDIWEIITTLSGFIAGFTYIVANGIPEFEHDIISWTNFERSDVYLFLVCVSFTFALTSTLVGFILCGVLHQIGYENAMELRKEHSVLCLIPEKTLILSIGFMLLSSLISVAGHGDQWVWIATLIIGLIFVVFMAYVFYIALGSGYVRQMIDKAITKKTMGKRKKGIVCENSLYL
eukprot:228438_1